MKKICLIVMLLVLQLGVFGQTFIKTYGGVDSESSKSMISVDDGYIILGNKYTSFFVDGDILLMKIDFMGNLVWEQIYEGVENDYPARVRKTADEGFIVACTTGSYGAGDYDIWLIKTDSFGNEEWNKTYGNSLRNSITDLQITQDNGYIITCIDYPIQDYINLLKLDSLGNLEWTKSFSETVVDMASSVIETKTDSSVDGYIVSGISDYGTEDGDYGFLLKLDLDGNKEWFKTYQCYANKVIQISDGDFVVAARTSKYGGSEYAYFKVSRSSGSLMWERIPARDLYGLWDGSCVSISETTDGGFINTGQIWTNDLGVKGWLVKTNSEGTVTWDKFLYYERDKYCTGVDVIQTNENGYIFAGYTNTSYNAQDIVVIKTDGSGNVSISNEQFAIDNYTLSQNYPNPFNPETMISYSLMNNAHVNLKVYDIAGREVCNLVDSKQNKGAHEVKFDGSMLTSGIYFYRLSIDDKAVENRKMMLLK